MISKPDLLTIKTIKNATSKLTGAKRRAFQVQVVTDHCQGNPKHARTIFGWHRKTLERGFLERETGEVIPDQPKSGRRGFFEKLPMLQIDIRELVDPNSQAEPRFKNTLRYTRVTAKSVLAALMKEKGYKQEELPAESTMRDLLGKMGYRLQRVQKTRPQKKFPKPTPSSPTFSQRTNKATKKTKH